MRTSWITYSLVICCLCLTSLSWGQPYLDATLPIADRVEDLLGRMTLAEKIGQMTQAERGQFIGGNVSNIATYQVGSILSGGGSSPGNQVADWVNMYNDFQAQALATPLGIPMIYGVDAVHGHNNLVGAVIFPHNIGLGCTRNPDLVEACARITALEVAATGVDWTFSPCVAVPRNERWGRTYEGFGEDPALVTQMTAAVVQGYQSDSLGRENYILACAKHYVGDGGTSGGADQGNAVMTEAELRSIHLDPYPAAIAEGVGSIMASFSQWNGLHMHRHEYLLTDVLKTELGFEGFVISDWEGINRVPSASFDSAIAYAINAGIDMAMQPIDYLDFQTRLTSLVQANVVSQARIDDAVRRILRVKFQLGLFEQPYADLSLADTVGCSSHRALARQAVRESLVLLQNEGNLLPLDKNQQVLVVGSRGDDIGAQCGGWSISWQGSRGDITPGTTIKEAIEAAIGPANVSYTSSSTIPTADVAIVVVGEDPYAEGAGDIPLGNDRFRLSAEDKAMIQAVKAQNIPMVVLILSGRPLILEDLLDDADAVIAAWLPGTEGDGVADILFGDYHPTGKLSHSWPRSESMVPINVGDAAYDPLFPYGFGLTYESSSLEQVVGEASPWQPFPNPFRSEITLPNPTRDQISLMLYDLTGRLWLSHPPSALEQISLYTEGLPAGTYLLHVHHSEGRAIRRIVHTP